MDLVRLVLHFVLGGAIIASAYYFATVVKDPALAAILGAFPLTILCCYIIRDRTLLREYARNMLSVLGLTFLLFIVMIALIGYTTIHPVIIVSVVLVLWLIVQWLRYQYAYT